MLLTRPMQHAKPLKIDTAQQMTVQERTFHLFFVQPSLWRMHEAMLDWQKRAIEPEGSILSAERICPESGSLRPEGPAG